MPNSHITSLHSPHVERVKALLGSRGKKFRREGKVFIADGIQSVREALTPQLEMAPQVQELFLTDSGLAKLEEDFGQSEFDRLTKEIEVRLVSDEVMKAMADTEAPQGILALCSYRENTLHRLQQTNPTRLAYFWEMQDPGNSGTVIRSADATGFDAVVFSEKSVDIYSPKTVRATAGSLWHLPAIEDVSVDELLEFAAENGFTTIALAGESDASFLDLPPNEKVILLFGNEARGLPELVGVDHRVHIPMKGHAESLNVAIAAAIAMFHFGITL